MPSITGSFAAKITKQNGMPLADHPNHELSLVEVSGTQESPDLLWNNSQVTYWAVTDVRDGKGTQTGYYNNVHGDKGRDWGTFEGKVTVKDAKMTVEGTYKLAGGEGEYRGVTGSGTPKRKPTDASESGGLPLFTLAAEMRPGHCFEARLRDRLLTDRAYAIRTVSHASERLIDRFQETPVALMQVDLKLSFRIGIGLVNAIALRAACSWHPS